jgi:7-carboxy-7-deazaguanine synthase
MKVSEIFTSVQGEGSRAGLPCTFVRFVACDLRCTYCDTEYAFYGGTNRPIDAILGEVASRGVPLVCVTGGEPMLQKEIVPFLEQLLAQGCEVLLETGGHRDLSQVPKAVVKIVDIKTPGSFVRGATADYARSEAFTSAHFHPANLQALASHDEVKVVITSRYDYEWARDYLRTHDIYSRVAHVHLSPSHGEVTPAALVGWLLEDRLPARLNLQLHKYIWDPNTRGV